MFGFYYVEFWIVDFDVMCVGWWWVFGWLGFLFDDEWIGGEFWVVGGVYFIFILLLNLFDFVYDCCCVGFNYFVFYGGVCDVVDVFMVDVFVYGWRLFYVVCYLYVGGF